MISKTSALVLTFLLISPVAFAEGDVPLWAQKQKIADKKFWAINGIQAGSSVFDYESSRYALDRCDRCYERNAFMRPFMESRPLGYVYIVATSAGITFASYKLKEQDNKLWFILPLAFTAAHTIAGAHNIRLALRF